MDNGSPIPKRSPADTKPGMDAFFNLLIWGLIVLAGWVLLIAFGFVAYGLWLVTSLLIGLF